MKDARMYINKGELADPMTNINRSPTAYQVLGIIFDSLLE